jgi:hypothetical protein
MNVLRRPVESAVESGHPSLETYVVVLWIRGRDCEGKVRDNKKIQDVLCPWRGFDPPLALVDGTQIGAIVSENALRERPGLRAVRLESPTPMRTPGIL